MKQGKQWTDVSWRIAAIILLASVTVAAGDARVTAINNQFTITLRDGWSVYDQTEAVSGSPSPFGMVILSSAALTAAGETTADPALLAKVDTGELPSFFVERHPADKGMSCSKLSKSVIYRIGTNIVQQEIFGTTRKLVGATPPDHTEIDLGGCKGVRFEAHARKKDPEKHWVVDLRAVSDGEVLYFFSLRNKAAHYDENRAAFDEALATVRLLKANPGGGPTPGD